MMKFEFEEIAGYKVTDEDYNNIIEPMYMATNLSKQDFVKTLNRKQFEVKPVKSEEQVAFENELKKERELLKAEISYFEEKIGQLKWFLETEKNVEDIVRWQNGIKNYKNEIRVLKSRIKSINWVLA